MKRLVNPQNAPVGGFRFVDPDTGYHYNHNYKTFEELEMAVQQYRQQNKLPRIRKFRAVWEHYVCENVPGMKGRCCQVGEVVKRSFEQYYNGGKSFVKAILSGKAAFVDQKTADRRAAVCKECDQNVVNTGHSVAHYYSDAFIKANVGARKSKFHDELHTCKICTCILKAKVFYNDEMVADSITDTELVQLTRRPKDKAGRHLKCWQLAALESQLSKEAEDGEEKEKEG